MSEDDLAQLREDLARITEERDAWKARAERWQPADVPAVSVHAEADGTIRLSFGVDIRHLAMNPLRARELATALFKAARETDNRRKALRKQRRHMH